VTDPQSGRTFSVPVPTGKAGKAIGFALDQVGDEWKFGEHGPDAWDCSGLTAAAWKTAGVRITAQSDAQKKSLRKVSLADARPGDIFWRKGYVSIYLGTVGSDRMVVGSLRTQGAVIIHTAEESDIKAVLRPQG
jgi:cell wall-associated NlpC family hydrolase